MSLMSGQHILFLLYHSHLSSTSDGKASAPLLAAEEDRENHNKQTGKDNKEQPDRTDDDVLIDIAVHTLKLYVVDDMENAEGRSLVPSRRSIICVPWHNPNCFRRFFICKDFLFRE